MCCLTVIKDIEDKVTFTHNRDENIYRDFNSEIIKRISEFGKEVLMPIDHRSGGTWIATDGRTAAAILNGHYQIHQKKASYQQSRGQIIPSLLNYPSVEAFFDNLPFSDFESFTLVVYQDSVLYKVVWDENESTLQTLDINIPQIFSSSTLYNQEIKSSREIIFLDWMKSKKTDKEVWNFHHLAGDPKSFLNVKLGNSIATVAITQLNYNDHKIKLNKLNLDN
jgi:hypothetical protein